MGSLLWGFHRKGPNDDSILYHKMCLKRKGNTRFCKCWSIYKINEICVRRRTHVKYWTAKPFNVKYPASQDVKYSPVNGRMWQLVLSAGQRETLSMKALWLLETHKNQWNMRPQADTCEIFACKRANVMITLELMMPKLRLKSSSGIREVRKWGAFSLRGER